MLYRLIILGVLIFAGAMSAAVAQVQPDKNMLMPEITKDWKTLETPHFRIHHEADKRETAQNLAAIAERVHGKLSAWLAWQPLDKTEVVILDTVDISNGHAFPLPYNNISIYLTPAVDGELMDQTPWLEMVFTHEYVHVLHLDMAFAAPNVMRNIFGRSTNLFALMTFPQIFSPTWVTEGLAVYGESDNDSNSGRLHSAYYEALMRMEVQRGLYSLTEVSFNSGFRWPYGQVYLYGAYFFKFVDEKYGRDSVTKYIQVYGRNVIPFRMDNRARQIFGKPAKTVWAEYQDYLKQKFLPQLETIKQQNRFITRTVYGSPYNNSSLSAAGNGDLYFLHDDASSSPKIMRLGADGSSAAVVDGRGVQDIDWHDSSGLLLSKFAVCDNTNIYAEIFHWQPGMTSAKRLTHCGRYTFAVWRPDGQAIAAIQSDHGISSVVLLDMTGRVLQVLADLPIGDTLGHIAWSPDGTSLVASIQRMGTGWNLEMLEVKTHMWQKLTANNELVQRPRFSKDGREIYFLSDHAKIWNLRRLKLGSNKIETISNTASGLSEAVLMPDSSYRVVEYTPNGKAIVALEATSKNNDVVMSYATMIDAVPVSAAIRNSADDQPFPYADVKDYSPWNTLKPHSWFPLAEINTDKTSYVGVMLSGSDALDFHKWNAVPLHYYEQRVLGGLADYSFYNTATLSAQRQFLMVGELNDPIRYREEEIRYQALLHHSFNTLDSSLYVAGGVASEFVNRQLYKGTGIDQIFRNKITGEIIQYDNSRFYKRSIAPVDGRRVQFLNESYDNLGGSDFSGKTSRVDWNEFIAMSDNRALHIRLLYAQGDSGIRPYRLGGVQETFSLIGGESGLGRRDFPLRGYAAGVAGLSGSNMGLATLEWKIPLGYHYDGFFVPPFGIGRESLSFFVDGGDAWNQGESVVVKTGVGLEWNIEALLGYDLLKLATTLGYAHGIDSDGEDRLYFRLSLPL